MSHHESLKLVWSQMPSRPLDDSVPQTRLNRLPRPSPKRSSAFDVKLRLLGELHPDALPLVEAIVDEMLKD